MSTKPRLIELGDGSGDYAVRVPKSDYNEAVGALATWLHGSPDRNIGGVTLLQARDALATLSGMSRDQLGQVAGVVRRLPGLGG